MYNWFCVCRVNEWNKRLGKWIWSGSHMWLTLHDLADEMRLLSSCSHLFLLYFISHRHRRPPKWLVCTLCCVWPCFWPLKRRARLRKMFLYFRKSRNCCQCAKSDTLKRRSQQQQQQKERERERGRRGAMLRASGAAAAAARCQLSRIVVIFFFFLLLLLSPFLKCIASCTAWLCSLFARHLTVSCIWIIQLGRERERETIYSTHRVSMCVWVLESVLYWFVVCRLVVHKPHPFAA
jgi:hypothetical protein